MSYNIVGKTVGRIGFGMISLMHPGRMSTADAIVVLKAAFNKGCTFWNASDYYGTPEYNSLHLLNAYFTKYPEDADKVVISVKSCIDVRNAIPHNDAASVKSNIEKVLKIFDGKCKLDIFQPGRLSREVPVEETVGAIAEYVKAGKVGGVGLSECSAASLRKASAVIPIAGVEVELSLFETGIFTNGLTDACTELGVPIIAYSPIGRGFLTGELRTFEDMAETDYRKMFPRFAKENFDNNIQLVDIAEKVAKQKGCSIVQVALAWVCQQGDALKVPVIPIPGTARVERLDENTADVTLTQDEMRQITEALMKVEVKGDRYPERHAKLLSI